MIPDCKHTSELLSQGQDRRLTVAEKIRLRLHLLLCQGCRNFSRQLAFMRTALQQYRDRD
jgi:predicted anti-sigma-YlaC factor YlaD